MQAATQDIRLWRTRALHPLMPFWVLSTSAVGVVFTPLPASIQWALAGALAGYSLSGST